MRWKGVGLSGYIKANKLKIKKNENKKNEESREELKKKLDEEYHNKKFENIKKNIKEIFYNKKFDFNEVKEENKQYFTEEEKENIMNNTESKKYCDYDIFLKKYIIIKKENIFIGIYLSAYGPKIVFDKDKDKDKIESFFNIFFDSKECIKELILFYNNKLYKDKSDIILLDNFISALVSLSTNSDDQIKDKDKDKINEIINVIQDDIKIKQNSLSL